MDWVTIVQTALASSTIIAVVLVLLGFIARSLFIQILSMDIEHYKISLQSEVEKLRATLERTGIEHQIRFESLHTRRAEIIAELYRLIVQAENDASSMASPLQLAGEPSQRDKYANAAKSGKELNEYFVRNRIYFSEELCKRIDNFIGGLHNAFVDFRMVIVDLEQNRNHIARLDQWQNTWNTLSKEIPIIKTEIEKEFRKLLGIEDAS